MYGVLIILALSTVACGQAAEAPEIQKGTTGRTIILFDPTIESTDIRTLLGGFSRALLKSGRIQEDSDALAWISNEAVTSRPGPVLHRSFDFNSGKNGAEVHQGFVQDWLVEAENQFEGAWREQRTGGKVKIKASCLISILSNVSEFLAGAPAKPTDLFVISDMLEVCSDWGPDQVNMEGALPNIDVEQHVARLANDSARSIISLQRVDTVYVLLQPHPLVQTPLQRATVRSVWQAVLKAFGLSKDAVFLQGVPEQLPAPR